MRIKNLPHLPIFFGPAIAASLLILACGLAYRALAARQPARVNSVPIAADALESFPRQIRNWVGRDTPLSKALVDAAGCDAHISRQYSQDVGLASVSLFVACGSNVNEVMSHRPTGCYRGAGWQLVDARSLKLPLDGNTNIPYMLYEFHRSGLNAETMTVLHYCYADGRYHDEVMQVLGSGWRGLRAIRCAAQVQIAASSQNVSHDSARRLVSAFAAESAPVLHDILEALGPEQQLD